MNKLDIQAEVVKRAMKDETFRNELLKDPKGTINKTFDLNLPDNIEVKAIEEDESTMTLFVPPYRGELSEDDLDSVAGGLCFMKRGHVCPIEC